VDADNYFGGQQDFYYELLDVFSESYLDARMERNRIELRKKYGENVVDGMYKKYIND
jgi:hypothetical protein